MTKTRSPYDDEIDILDFILTLWNGKWIILATTLISFSAMFGYLSFQKIVFEATSEIKPISVFDFETYKALNDLLTIYSSDNEKYKFSNNLEFFQVTPERLLSLYVEQLDERTVLEKAILKYELLDPKNFEDEQTFNEAVVKFAYSIELIPPVKITKKDKTKKEERKNWLLEAEYNDEYKWKQFLSYVNSETNQNVRDFLQKSFKNSLLRVKQRQAFNIEDVNTKIENKLADYDRETADRLFFLKEQTAIARKLGVARNTIEAQTYGRDISMIANLTTEAPYYLRGYEAIEKEIELIETRQNKDAFVSGLMVLDQERRKLEQDGILLERAETLFNNTPITKGDDFMAASMTVGATKFKTKERMMMMMSLVAVLGGIIAIFYVLISKAIHNRRNNKVKA